MARPGQHKRREREEWQRKTAAKAMAVAVLAGDVEHAKEFLGMMRTPSEIKETLRTLGLELRCPSCDRAVAVVSSDSDGTLSYVGAIASLDPHRPTKNRIFDATPEGDGAQTVVSKGRVRIEHLCHRRTLVANVLRDAKTRKLMREADSAGRQHAELP